jgi:prophage tail gpP-like protein
VITTIYPHYPHTLVTVHGWLRPSGGLWDRNQTVFVTSPMLIMNQEPLITKVVTFTQDNETGARTTLELCNPSALGPIGPPIT